METKDIAMELDNKMLVFLISDPTTDKYSAAMDIHIGHLSDHEQFAGLAHFCEHMLFLVTEKYPKENYYSKFLKSNRLQCFHKISAYKLPF